jgi:plasmid maintenance system antidote protein VapI
MNATRQIATTELITVEEAAKRLNVTPNAIYKLIYKKKLDDDIVQRFFGRTNINWTELMRQMEAGKLSPKPRTKKNGPAKTSEADRRAELHESLREVEVATPEPEFIN